MRTARLPTSDMDRSEIRLAHIRVLFVGQLHWRIQRGARDSTSVKFFHSHAVFGKNLAK